MYIDCLTTYLMDIHVYVMHTWLSIGERPPEPPPCLQAIASPVTWSTAHTACENLADGPWRLLSLTAIMTESLKGAYGPALLAAGL